MKSVKMEDSLENLKMNLHRLKTKRNQMDDQILQKLANIAVVKNHITNSILNVGRGVIPKPMLHQIQVECGKLDRMFVDLILENAESSEGAEIANISQRVAEEKAKLNTQSVAHVSVEEATKSAMESVNVLNVDTKAKVKAKTKKSKKKKSKSAKKKGNSVVVVNAPQ